MKKLIVFQIIFIAIISSTVIAQSANFDNYIKTGKYPIKLNVYKHIYHSDLIINMAELFGNDADSRPSSIISYRYLGVDNLGSLHILREKHDYLIDREESHMLIFQLDSENTGEITLTGQLVEVEESVGHLLVKLKVKASNHGLEVEYLGDLPIDNNP